MNADDAMKTLNNNSYYTVYKIRHNYYSVKSKYQQQTEYLSGRELVRRARCWTSDCSRCSGTRNRMKTYTIKDRRLNRRTGDA